MEMTKTLSAVAAAFLMTTVAASAQSTGASPADPNNERNQRPAPSNTQPADPGTDDPAARVPTDPEDAASADREEGGASGASSGDEGVDVVEPDLPSDGTMPGKAPANKKDGGSLSSGANDATPSTSGQGANTSGGQ
jgi:hypothetical protein